MIDYSLKTSRRPTYKVSPRYRCTNCHHRSTEKQAKTNKWDCTHCGSPLAAKALKISELKARAKDLGMEIKE